MIKGCAKRVVVVRNMDSNLFEEAFFIVKAGQSAKKSTEEEFLGEAERLVKTTPVQSSADSDTDTPAKARFRIAPKNASVSAGVPLGGSLAVFDERRSEAAKKALKEGKCIREKPFNVKVKLVKSDVGVLMKLDGNHPVRGWQPTAEELTSENWEVVE